MNATISHPLRDNISVTVGPASREDWAAAHNAIAHSSTSDAGMLLAGYNLLHSSALKSPTRAEAEAIADAWPKICHAVYVQVFVMSGGIAVAPPEVEAIEGEKRRAALAPYAAWHLDLDELWGAAKRMRELELGGVLRTPEEAEVEGKELAELHRCYDEDLGALQTSGIDASQLDRLARTFDDGALVALRTREHGVFLLRRPGFMAVLDFASNGASADAFAAVERLAMAAVEHPSPATMPEVFRRLPALASVLAGEARKLLGSDVAAVIKKG